MVGIEVGEVGWTLNLETKLKSLYFILSARDATGRFKQVFLLNLNRWPNKL